MAELKCRKCGDKDVNSESVKRIHLWAVILGLSLIALGIMLFCLGFLIETYGLSRVGPIVTVIPGVSILAFGFRQHPTYIYTCKSCGKTWKRSTKDGPEEEDPKYIEYQTEWHILRLTYDSGKDRKQAAKWIGEHKVVSAVEALITCLGERKLQWQDSRIEAISALRKIGDERAIQPLINAATDTGWKYKEVRVAALFALSAFESDEIRKILEDASNEEDADIRMAATKSLTVLNQSVEIANEKGAREWQERDHVSTLSSPVSQEHASFDDTKDEKPKLFEKVNAPCNWSGNHVSGLALAFDDYINSGLTKKDIIGYVCPFCDQISHSNCAESGIKFNWWSGYEKSRCAACGKAITKPKVVLPEDKILSI